MTRSNTPTLAEIIRESIESRLDYVHVAIPAIVESYDSSDQKVSVRPGIKKGYTDEEGIRRAEELPVVTDVPVMFPGSGGMSVVFPISKGDPILLIFSESSLDKWLSGGGVVDPEDDSRFSLTDAVAVPGLRDFTSSLSSAPTDRMRIGNDDGVEISIDSSEIRLGSDSASDPVALKSDLTILKNAIANALVAPNDGGATLQTNIVTALNVAGFPQSSTKVKAE